MRGDRARLANDLLRRQVEGRAGHGRRARAAGAFAVEHLIGVALHVLHLVGIEPEPVADQLLEYGFVALALAIGAREYCRGAGAVAGRSRRSGAPSVWGAGPRSMVLEIPNPRGLPAFRACPLRALKPLKSE